MNETPTQDQFDEALRKISCGHTSLVLAETEDEADRAREKYLAGRATALFAFNAQAERIKNISAHSELAYEILGQVVGYRGSLGMLARRAVGRIAELEAMLSRLQWCGEAWAYGLNICPVCDKRQDLGLHSNDCALAALLPKEETDE